MNCIVTAGPTYEPLDEVRRLTNFSTGRLGTELATFLAARGHQVTLLLGVQATHRAETPATIQLFTTTADLAAKLKAFSDHKVDAIFHASAVSDFAFGKLFMRSADGNLEPFVPSKKISTRQGNLMVELMPTPKILAQLRGWFPRAQIIGWKFEADGGRADALQAAQRQITECATNACVANGPAYGRGFGLVTAAGQQHYSDPKELYAALQRLLVGPDIS
ncbi:MAG TPA: phosphopantothenoylcysteine decarboxylase [Verrucomicrobiae bacterium]